MVILPQRTFTSLVHALLGVHQSVQLTVTLEIMDKDKKNEFMHEAIDRAYIVLSHLEFSLAEHPAIKNDPELQDVYEKAHQALFDLYQKAGEKM